MEQQTETGAQPAASPTAPVDSSSILSSLSGEQYAHWTKTGELPTPDAAADSSPAPSGDQSVSTETKPAASEAATPVDKPAKNVKTRSAELDAEIAELNRKLELRRTLREELASTQRPVDATPAESSTAKSSSSELDRYKNHPDAPKTEDFDVYEDYLDARAVFLADRRYEDRQRAESLDRESKARLATIEQTIADFSQGIAKAKEADPDFESKVDPRLMAIKPAFALGPKEQLGPHNVLVEEIVKSDQRAALLLHFSSPEGQEDWKRLCGLQPAAMLKAFGRIEARLETPGPAAGEKPPAKTVTSAPDPPLTLGKKPAQPADSAEGAIKAGDYRAYEAIENARAVAAHR